MVPSILYLVVGFFIGALVCSLALYKIFNANKKKQAAAVEERNQLIRSIAEMLADIDTLITSFRSGLLKEDSFHNSLDSKLDLVNKLYKPNMHILDVYYVKYIDSQIHEYSQLSHAKISHFQFEGKPAFEDENCPNGAMKSDISISKSKSESAADFFTDNPVNNTLPESVKLPDNDKTSDELLSENDKVEEPAFAEDIDADVKSSANSDDEFDLSNAIETNKPVADPIASESDDIEQSQIEATNIEEEKPVIVDEKPEVVEEHPVVMNRLSINDEKESTAKSEEIIVCEEANETDDDEMIFEVEPSTIVNKNKSPITETTIDMSSKAEAFSFESQNAANDNSSVIPEPKPVINPFDGDEKSSFQKEFEQASKESQDEDLMETIMDLDMSKILRAGSMSVDSKTPLPPKYASSFKRSSLPPSKIDEPVQQTAKINEQENLGGVLHETILIKEGTSEGEPVQPVISPNNQEKIIVARGEDGADTILEDSPVDFEVTAKHAEEAKDVTITGDDVASKIDSFFGIK